MTNASTSEMPEQQSRWRVRAKRLAPFLVAAMIAAFGTPSAIHLLDLGQTRLVERQAGLRWTDSRRVTVEGIPSVEDAFVAPKAEPGWHFVPLTVGDEAVHHSITVYRFVLKTREVPQDERAVVFHGVARDVFWEQWRIWDAAAEAERYPVLEGHVVVIQTDENFETDVKGLLWPLACAAALVVIVWRLRRAERPG